MTTTDNNKIIDVEEDMNEFDVLAEEDYEAYMERVAKPITGGALS